MTGSACMASGGGLLEQQVASLGFPLEKVLISKNATNDDYESSMGNILAKYKDAGVTSVVFGDRLIKAAYWGEYSKLTYKVNGKDYTAHLHDLISGAYTIFRNPRSHILVEDDEQSAQAIIALVELLIGYVDESEDRIMPLEIDKKQTST